MCIFDIGPRKLSRLRESIRKAESKKSKKLFNCGCGPMLSQPSIYPRETSQLRKVVTFLPRSTPREFPHVLAERAAARQPENEIEKAAASSRNRQVAIG